MPGILNLFTLVSLVGEFLPAQLRRVPVPTTSYAGRTVIVTGANGGLGLEAARHFARLGAARLILACRSTERGEAARADIERSLGLSDSPTSSDADADAGSSEATGTGHAKGQVQVEVWPLDLCSFESVRAFCRLAAERLDRLDVLLANAGVLALYDVRMAEGYEVQVTTNVISNFLMVAMLLPLMRRTAARFNVEPAVTVVASVAHMFTGFVEKDEPRIFECFRPGGVMEDRYGTTKLLDMLLVQELAEQLDASSGGASPVVVNSANPGLCKSSLFKGLPGIGQVLMGVANLLIGRTSEQGARALLAAVAAGRESHGGYVDSGRIAAPGRFLRSEQGRAAQKKVWAELMEILDGIEPGLSTDILRG